jgi:hypothetical protein
MKILSLKIVVAASLLSTVVNAGGSSGGGIPPAREQLEQVLLSRDMANAGLFRNEVGGINLGVKGPLDQSLVLAKSSLMSARSAGIISISAEDFDVLGASASNHVEAVNLGISKPKTENIVPLVITRSYNIESGDNLGELILKDRREAARDSVKQ